MTESDRHANTVNKIKGLLRMLDAQIWENDNERGKGGWRFPEIITEKGKREYTADIFARLKSCAMVDFEIDFMFKGSPLAQIAMLFRDACLKSFGIVTIRLTPKMCDGMTKEQLQEEIDYWLNNRMRIAKEIVQ